MDPNVAEAGQRALRDAGFLNLSPLMGRLGRSSASVPFGAVATEGVLGVVDLVPSSGDTVSDDVFSRSRVRAYGLPRLSRLDMLLRRSARITANRRPRLRDLLEMHALLTTTPQANDHDDVAVAIYRCASLERSLVPNGSFQEAAATLPRAARVVDLRHRVKANHSAVSRRISSSVRRPQTLAVGFSGIDGAGKSTQAALLVESLRRLGIPTQIVWSRLGANGVLIDRLTPLRRRLTGVSKPATRALAGGTAVETFATRRGLVGWTWALVVTVDYLLSGRVGRRRQRQHVLVRDRTVLDASVGLELGYGGLIDLRFHKWLLGAGSSGLHIIFYLRLDGRTALARKADDFTHSVLDQYVRSYDTAALNLLGVTTLDAAQPKFEIHRKLLREVVQTSARD